MTEPTHPRSIEGRAAILSALGVKNNVRTLPNVASLATAVHAALLHQQHSGEAEQSQQSAMQGDAIEQAIKALETNPGAMFERDTLAELRTIRSKDAARFARIRAEVKASKCVSMTEFGKLTARESNSDEQSMFTDDAPWSDPVCGHELLDDIVSAIRRHVVADPPTIQAAALWAVHTWLLDAVTVTPIANVTAPEMRCGKSVLLTALGRLSYRPLQVANIAPAALFRAIEAWSPTLLIDEVDTFLREHEEARGIINSGFTRDSAYVIRCVGDDHTPTKFSTWGAKALCGIGKIADTLADRSIPLRLRRKTANETAQNIRYSDADHWQMLRAQVARWTDDNRRRVASSRPAVIDGMGDRANDCWEPLLAIAETAGGHWSRTARAAAVSLHGLDGDSPTIGAQLLADVRDAFGNRDRMGTAELLTALVADEESPWPTWNKGRPMTARQLSSRLGEFGIRPTTIRIGPATPKGYTLAQFADAFDRYLSGNTPHESATPQQSSNGAGSSPFPSATRSPHVADSEPLKASNGAGCGGVADKTPPAAESVLVDFRLREDPAGVWHSARGADPNEITADLRSRYGDRLDAAIPKTTEKH